MGKTYSNQQMISHLSRKGFKPVEGHHHFLFFHHDGKRTAVKTKVSHSKKVEYGGNLLSAVRKQVLLDSNNQLCRLLDCPMSVEEYVKILIDKGVEL